MGDNEEGVKVWTDYPFTFSPYNDEPNKEAPIREVRALTFDRNKYVKIRLSCGLETTVKAGYLYVKHGRFGEVKSIKPWRMPGY